MIKNNIMNKICTNIEQSKKLIELELSADTADMHYWEAEGKEYLYVGKCSDINGTPAWSLPALLNVIPCPSLHKTFSGWRCDSYIKEGTFCSLSEPAENPIDACYELIIKLYNLNLL